MAELQRFYLEQSQQDADNNPEETFTNALAANIKNVIKVNDDLHPSESDLSSNSVLRDSALEEEPASHPSQVSPTSFNYVVITH